ncbi:MAG TPA: ABC transporter permease [Vicinamibacterales bacterium]|nr:ABC transporter permease [Vicinamibacterales bacterium]
MSAGSRLFDLLLRASPRAARERFGAGMRYGWARDLAEARSRGRRAVAGFWIVTIIEACRFAAAERTRGASLRGSLTIDWRDAWRSLRAAPLVSAFAVLSLALGIGGATALFSILNTLAMKPLPVRDPYGLLLLDQGSWTNPIWEAIRDRQSGIAAGAFAWAGDRFNISPSGAADTVQGLWVSGSMFEVLGVGAEIGRTISPADDVRGGGADGPVAVIGYGFWQRRYGGAPDVIGRSLSIERVPFTIVGVAPQGFFGPDVGRSFDVAIPLGAEPLVRGRDSSLDQRSRWWMNVMARLRPGQTIEDATARLRAVQPQIRQATLPALRRAEDAAEYLAAPLTFVAAPGGRSILRPRYERPLTIVLGVVGIVLLIACANVANLLIARATARRPELTLRLALGASRWRLGRQLLAESAMLGAAGAALGVWLAGHASRLLVAQLSSVSSSVSLDLTLDPRVLGFTIAVSLGSVLLFGAAPALTVSRLSPNDVLREHGRTGSMDRPTLVRHASVVIQVALSLALVVAATLLTRTFVQLVSRDAGFDRRGVLLVNADLSRSGVATAALGDALQRLVNAVEAVPGVSSAAASFTTPVAPAGWNTPIAVPEGSPLTRRERMSWMNAVSPGWFSTLGVRLVAGRDFNAGDRHGAPAVAIVNRAFERRFLGGRPAIGQIVRRPLPGRAAEYEVVGVVEDAVYRSLRAPMEPTMYLPLLQADDTGPVIVLSLRSQGVPPRVLVKSVAAALEREQPAAVLGFQTLDEQVQTSLAQERLVATVAGFFGGLGLLLAAIGLYGVTSHGVTLRRGEIGIRMALGASADGVIRMIIARVARLVALGIVLGAALSAWAATYVRTLLYGLEPRDPWTFAAAALLLTVVAALAAWLPARRASRIDPMQALRN